MAVYAPLVDPGEPTGVAALDRERKSTGGVNYNHRLYPAVARRYLGIAGAVVAAEPAVVGRALRRSACLYLRPARDTSGLPDLHAELGPYTSLFARTVLLQPVPAPDPRRCDLLAPDPGGLASVSLTALAVLTGALLVLARALLAWRRTGRPDTAVVVMGLTVAYVLVVALLLEVGENQRFRLLTLPYSLVLVTAGAERWLARRRPSGGSRRGSGAGR